ncbi:SRPBCC family protein [Agrococcus terreus]|uniref:SRPBCC family protein n=1 Tax=Agrococcus terreus TaxID=574649 RepID=UPI00384DE60C
MESRHLAVVIRRDPAAVAGFARAHLAEWAAGLAAGDPRPDPADPAVLVVDSPMGEVRVRFAPPNDLGVLDHAVTLSDGGVVRNPLRVLPHPHGAEVVFTLRHLDGVTDEAFEADAAAVRADLDRLRALLGP